MNDQQQKAIDRELKEFEDWFRSIGNSPLSKFELAILKTYIAAVMLEKFKSSLSDH